jgi:hypothetical protein
MIVEQLGHEARSARAAIAEEASGLSCPAAVGASCYGAAGMASMASISPEDESLSRYERAPLLRCPSPSPPTACVRPRVPPRGPPLAGARSACGTALDCWGAGSAVVTTRGMLALCGDISAGAEQSSRRGTALGGG